MVSAIVLDRSRAPQSAVGSDWRTAASRILRLWRTSLQFRTVAITIVLSGIAVTLTGAYMSASIGDNLFTQRRNQVSAETAQAAELAQEIFNSALTSDDSSQVDLESLSTDAQGRILSSTTSPGSTGIAILREPGQITPVNMTPAQSRGFPSEVLSDDLRTAVQKDTGKPAAQPATDGASSKNENASRVYLQSVQLPGGSPGIAAGSLLDVPNAGHYELYLVYDLSDAQETLGFVQRTLVIGGLALVLLISAVTYLVVRLVVGPIRFAAETSEKLAAGQLEQRIPVRGEDVIATLGRSFNRMADSLQKQITKLAELSRVQQRFVADVSHELRTPLTTIRLAGDVLYDQRDGFEPATRRTAELLHAQVQRFEALLADLLEISRFDAGAVELELEPTNLVRLVEESVEAVRPLADKRGSDLRVVAPGGYFEADVDARRIRRILRNLLGNAIEHGDAKPIVVTVDSNASAVAIAVRDHGTGIKQNDASQVFERFWRADPSRQRTIGGTGLGLSIALEDAALHDGVLEVWSEEGMGTCFRLTLPRELGGVVEEYPVSLPPDDPATELEESSA